MLALAVLVRAPSKLDLYHHPDAIDASLLRLADTMLKHGQLTPAEHARIRTSPFHLEPPPAMPSAAHFINYIRETVPFQLSERGTLPTTLDASLQQTVQSLLDQRIRALAPKRVHNGAALVVDHRTGEILAWAVGGAGGDATPSFAIDAVRSPRQPGSAMKPFLYALALDSGWSPATILDDAPMAEAIGSGMHDFHNYSHTFYGPVSLREALGNSLNIPALETINFVGAPRYLTTLHALGFSSLTQPASFYNEGLALGNGEVTLFEMVQAYSAIAYRGQFRPLTPLAHDPATRETRPVYSEEAASLIGHILSDALARRREFGTASVLNLPGQTAVKTGTSTDYRDAWVMGFNARYTVGIWLGNLNQTPMDGITGSTGPALVLRSIFSELERRDPSGPLYLSPKLERREICSEQAAGSCYKRTEYFLPNTAPKPAPLPTRAAIHLLRPSNHLHMAYDPRLPAETQAFEFAVTGVEESQIVAWYLNDQLLAHHPGKTLLWPVARGHYTLRVNAVDADGHVMSGDQAEFLVK